MISLGLCYDSGEGVAQDYAQAAYWYRKAAELGDATAMFNLAVCYADGEGVPQDLAEAARWYRKAAELGNSHVRGHVKPRLAACYENGQGVAQDQAEADRWYRKADRKADEKSPEHWRAWRRRDLDEALRHARHADAVSTRRNRRD